MRIYMYLAVHLPHHSVGIAASCHSDYVCSDLGDAHDQKCCDACRCAIVSPASACEDRQDTHLDDTLEDTHLVIFT